MMWKSRALTRLAIVTLVAIACLNGAAAQDDTTPSQAHLIVHKYVVEDQLVIGKNMTIKIDVYNAGESPASAVLIDDPMWDTDHFHVLGATRASFPVLEPGKSVSLSFVVVPKSTGVFSAGPSLVTYVAGTAAGSKGAEISGTSNALPRIPILSQLEEHLKLALRIGSVLSFGFCRTKEDWANGSVVFLGLVGLLFVNQILLTGKRAIAANKRRKAIAELTKDE